MPILTLTDLARDLWTDSFAITPDDLGLAGRAGLVDHQADAPRRPSRRRRPDPRCTTALLSVDVAADPRAWASGAGQYRGDRLGWSSPVTDGPVHPRYVNLAGLGGFGWLEGFDELLARCGLEHNGPPVQDGPFAHSLHGRIQNIAGAGRDASRSADAPPYELVVEGQVDEARLFGPRLRMTTRYSTIPGSNRLIGPRRRSPTSATRPAALSVLYHWNFGPPYLEDGARLPAPARLVAPQTPRAAEGIGRFDTYGPPEPGFAEQVYLMELLGDGPDGPDPGHAAHRLGRQGRRPAVRDGAAALLHRLEEHDGPEPRGTSPASNRRRTTPTPGPSSAATAGSSSCRRAPRTSPRSTLEVLDTAEAVAAVEAEVDRSQQREAPRVLDAPEEPYAPRP